MIVEKFMFYKDKLPILDLVEFKKLSWYEMHKKPYSRYLGYEKMIAIIRTLYFWPRMEKGIEN